MSIYAIADLHLSVAAKKPMDIFSGWDNHAEKLIENWRKKIKQDDTVVLAGDTSWGMTLAQAIPDLRLIHKLPGRKIIIKGNHDYWWASVRKMTAALEEHELFSLSFLHNNSYFIEGMHICGSRGWIFENGEKHDEKLIRREACRIESSLKSRGPEKGKTVLFLHFPPVFSGQTLDTFINLMRSYGVAECYYGHIHGPGHKYAVEGDWGGIRFSMISSDYLGFAPVLVT